MINYIYLCHIENGYLLKESKIVQFCIIDSYTFYLNTIFSQYTIEIFLSDSFFISNTENKRNSCVNEISERGIPGIVK